MSRIKLLFTFILLFGWAVSCFALDVIPPREELVQTHPRILLTADDSVHGISLSRLRSRTDHPEYEAMLAKISGLGNAACQAMVWQLTGDSTAADSAAAMIKRYTFDSSRNYDVFDIWFELLEYALAYDWMYDYGGLSSLDKGMFRIRINELAKRGLAYQNDHIFHNYIWMTAAGTTIWALAAAGEDSTSDAIYDAIRTRMNDYMYPGMQYLDGLPTESYGYWSQYDFTGAVWTVLAAQSASGSDITGKIAAGQGGWLHRHYLNEIHNVLPDMRFTPWGDVIGGANGSVTHEMAGVLDAAGWALTAPEAPWFSQWLAARRGTGRFYGITGVFYMLYTRFLDAAASEPALSFTAGGGSEGGVFTAHSSWDADATVVSFGVKDHYGDHNHYDAGHFTIYRHGLLATDPTLYDQVNGPQQPSDVHSTLVIGGNKQEARHGQNHSSLESFISNLDKGQRLNTGDFLFSGDGGGWAAASGQYAQAYAPGVVQSCVRQLLFIRPDIVVVMDHLAAPEGGTLGKVDWLLQTAAEPHVQELAGEVWAAGDSSYLVCMSIQPSPEITAQQTAAGPWRVKFSYQLGAAAMITHMLKAGDGATADIDFGQIEMIKVEGGYDLKYRGFRYHFSDSGDYSVTGGSEVQGDLNLDEKLDIFDVLKLLGIISDRHYLPARSDPADVNRDSKVDIFDLLSLLKMLKA